MHSSASQPLRRVGVTESTILVTVVPGRSGRCCSDAPAAMRAPEPPVVD
ncbi:hypothetical protein ACFPM0_11565 [Pseudonocardia sulfidoxydans]